MLIISGGTSASTLRIFELSEFGKEECIEWNDMGDKQEEKTSNLKRTRRTSAADPDSYVFGPHESGSIGARYGTGSLHDFYCFVTSLCLFIHEK